MNFVAEENDEFLRLLANSGWNQARAARELGTTTATVSRYVTGKIVPSIPVLRLFAERLGETLLLPGSPYSATSLGDSPRWLANWESDAIYLLRRLDPEPRAKLIEAVRSMVESMAGRERYRGGRAAAARPASWSDGWGLWGAAGACVCLVAAGCVLFALFDMSVSVADRSTKNLLQAYFLGGAGIGIATPGLLMIVIDRLVWMSRRR